MESIAKADIFFFIASISVVVVTLLLATVLVMAINILRSVKRSLREVRWKTKLVLKLLQNFIR